jgi:hypothetical protein
MNIAKSLLSLLLGLGVSQICAAENLIPIWVRKAGDYTDGGDPGRLQEKKIDLEKLKLENRELLDIQYGKKANYRAILLNDLISRETAGMSGDLVLLHFENQMIVPVPMELFASNDEKFAIWIAVKYRAEGEGKWLDKFPNVVRPDVKFKDPSPLKFKNNKLVVGPLWRPSRADPKDSFSPWKHVGSLTGIELVQEAAYDRQFETVGKKDLVAAGRKIFLTRCQYCHGVRMVGAKYGWDFVSPLPIYQKRSADSLFLHVQVPKQDKIEMGIHMPHQPDFTPVEAKQLWKWLEVVAENRLKEYKP